MVCFQTKNQNLGKFWRVLLWKILVYFMTIWSMLRPLEIFYGRLVYFLIIWHSFPRFGILDERKSGNPGWKTESPPVAGYLKNSLPERAKVARLREMKKVFQ
jgi:hypothetical protein